MSVDDVLDRIGSEFVATQIPDNVAIPELAEQVVRGKVELTPPQQRMLIELLPYYMPKLSATAIASIDGQTFAEALERCIERSKSPPLLNGSNTIIEHEELVSAITLKKPFPRNYRRF
jgi:hypothetical protein